ncbi:MAG: hypothetical protein U5K56_00975 [Halioglobus sp.]|nr:hypothetical protein [Halioglobus sp.]
MQVVDDFVVAAGVLDVRQFLFLFADERLQRFSVLLHFLESRAAAVGQIDRTRVWWGHPVDSSMSPAR